MKRGLGKGLGALISSDSNEEQSIIEIKINDVEPNLSQPRKSFDKEKLESMAESIKEHGIIQPLVVRKNNDKYEIIAGERRWRAAKIAGLTKVPIIIKNMSDKQVMEAALIENLQREDLNAIEEARGYDNLIKEYNLTQEEIAKIIGKSRSAVANTLRLLTLEDNVQQMIIQNKITSGHARTLVTIEDATLQYNIAKQIEEKGLSVRETEKLIKTIQANKDRVKKVNYKNPIFIDLEDNLKKVLGTKVTILNNKNKGKIEIEYYSNDDLERIINILKG